MEKIVILGSTGSIGCNALEVIKLHKEKYKVFALTANKNVDLLTQQCVDFEPEFVIALNQDANQQLKKNLLALNIKTIVLDDEKSLDWLASHKDTATVISAIVGAAGLMPTMAAANSGKKILLANKETLVMAGELFVKAVKKSNAILIPIDSEHNAILQVLPQSKKMNYKSNSIRKILLTASGGPFPEVLEHDIFLNSILAMPGCPVFVPAEATGAARRLSAIGDIACDPTSDFSPVKVYDRTTTWEEPVIRVHDAPPLDVMAIDNLPSMLPKESSEDFAAQLLPHLLELEALEAGVWGRAQATFAKHIVAV